MRRVKNCVLLIPIEFSLKSYMMYYAVSVSVVSQSLLWIPFHKRTHKLKQILEHRNTHAHIPRAYTLFSWNDRIICCRRLFSFNISTLRFSLYLLLKVNIIPWIWAQDCVHCVIDADMIVVIYLLYFLCFVLIFGVL